METKTVEFPGIDMKGINENLVHFVRFSLDATYNAVSMTQDIGIQIYKNAFESGKQIQAEMTKIVDVVAENAKKGTEEYRRICEQSLKTVEKIYS
ncbi:MAG TPA: hypothetical protein VEI28_03260 [Thermodesulfovibrionales bacterium]|nr:hypothetical protein [Thermodesulfovibrionales bacterium]